jgi:hypothetical protein
MSHVDVSTCEAVSENWLSDQHGFAAYQVAMS